MKITWFEEAWVDYEYWLNQDKKTMRRINLLIRDAMRNGYTGIGKPEPLRNDLSGYWSRRIDEVNRLVYRIENDTLEILSCKGHYE